MTNIDNLTKAARNTLSFTWMPEIRVAIPALKRNIRNGRRFEKPVSRLEREDLMELFSADFTEMQSLKHEKSAHRNVVRIKRTYTTPFTNLMKRVA